MAEGRLPKLSVLPLLPVFHVFLFIGVHASVHIYEISRFAPMHALHLEMSRHLKRFHPNLDNCDKA